MIKINKLKTQIFLDGANFSDIKKRKKIADRMGISLDELSIIRKRTLLNARNKVACFVKTFN